MRYTDRKTQRKEKKTEETRAMRYTDRKTQKREEKENRRDTRHEIH